MKVYEVHIGAHIVSFDDLTKAMRYAFEACHNGAQVKLCAGYREGSGTRIMMNFDMSKIAEDARKDTR